MPHLKTNWLTLSLGRRPSPAPHLCCPPSGPSLPGSTVEAQAPSCSCPAPSTPSLPAALFPESQLRPPFLQEAGPCCSPPGRQSGPRLWLLCLPHRSAIILCPSPHPGPPAPGARPSGDGQLPPPGSQAGPQEMFEEKIKTGGGGGEEGKKGGKRNMSGNEPCARS